MYEENLNTSRAEIDLYFKEIYFSKLTMFNFSFTQNLLFSS